MFDCIDHIIIAVADLTVATASYRTLLGRAPSWRGRHPAAGTQNTLFRLDNTYVELLAADPEVTTPFSSLVREALEERVEQPLGLALGVHDIKATVNILRGRGVRVSDPVDGEGVDERSGRQRAWQIAVIDPTTAAGLRLFLVQHTTPRSVLPHALAIADDTSVCFAVDHVVVATGDLNATLQLWTGTFRIDEQWRREFPERHTRNVGLTLGDITIELIMRTDRVALGTPDRLWGVAYRVLDCDRAAERVRTNDIVLDDPRPGLAPGTRVTTVRWHRTHTLLLARETSPSPA